MSGIPRPETVGPCLLARLAELLPADLTGGDVPVTGVTHSSREVRPGDLYAALPGANRHGAEFTADAARSGAVAVLTDPAGRDRALAAGLPVLVADDPRAVLGAAAAAIYGDPSRRLTMIGVTGTAGKTSTSYLVEAGLRAAGKVTGLVGTVETRLGDLVVKSVRTTPEATDLQAILANGVERGVEAVVMEVSSHALVMGRADGIRFAAGGYTNFGQDHLDFHPTSEDYFEAKARLFDGRSAAEVLNFDDPALLPLRRPATITYSASGSPDATWWATGIQPSDFGQTFTAHGPDGLTVETGVALPGLHNVANALLALALLVAAGVDARVAGAGIAACRGVPGRLEQVEAAGEVLGVVDYAHKPNAIVAALAALRGLADTRGGRLICVLGAGGDRDQGKRPLMGEAAAHGSDLVIVTDDNPRTEDPAFVRSGVRAGAEAAHSAAKVIEVAGRRAAIAEAVRMASAGDVIAVLGKGNEQGQEVNGEVLPFDDRIELSAALEARA
ncbi:UDP-N-acetylmuramoyl-L-alanyl-D-glutamate--2,6-diaminopimelate ligase [Actinoplanes derwentensis]|uniref:UDP-N-acetylmuramoyl-L-alanyl-D-glutamate--2,6-diaminopimelate ligase n=1 Tax=Actinoplanes derwentensis TaxID=113562 RepID=A0A1H2BZK4_9ACTN|nr:UDP-N-acetylmuramoyl-L-alanyl-D-glutamate--2,6-diaminopimelate ligase [Actinoplanes derwentensis]GID84625.1 UDP-N-acetylmuramoyl-L-alanyl-D-glutamate--2,6-diaminopimelate ligase [Actinoplanes derwentensis]SDT63641.1 UDP-N-acetylmuramoylalanyl-D-glutamate--2,6-diaminopimelate ligase [Actinoplanes derwentensis]